MNNEKPTIDWKSIFTSESAIIGYIAVTAILLVLVLNHACNNTNNADQKLENSPKNEAVNYQNNRN